MIDLYYWPTPNGWKVAIMLEEVGLPYRLVPVNIGRVEQFEPEFLAINPNNRIPAIVDHAPIGSAAPLPIFESGAILLYVADKTGKLMPHDVRARVETTQWLMWQMGGFGPMLGQTHHFRKFASDPIPYAIERYTNEANRLYGVLNRRLAGSEYIAGPSFTIADVACFPWASLHADQGQTWARPWTSSRTSGAGSKPARRAPRSPRAGSSAANSGTRTPRTKRARKSCSGSARAEVGTSAGPARRAAPGASVRRRFSVRPPRSCSARAAGSRSGPAGALPGPRSCA
jgi:GSH-dependent disulfide-bond oxidoreductase